MLSFQLQLKLCERFFGADAIYFIRKLGRRIACDTGECRATEYLLQRISVAVQRGNAAAVMGTVDFFADKLHGCSFFIYERCSFE